MSTKLQSCSESWADRDKIFAHLSEQLSDSFVIEFEMDQVVTVLIFGEHILKRVHIECDDGKYFVGDGVTTFKRSSVALSKTEWCILMGDEIRLHTKQFETSNFTTVGMRTYYSPKAE